MQKLFGALVTLRDKSLTSNVPNEIKQIVITTIVGNLQMKTIKNIKRCL